MASEIPELPGASIWGGSTWLGVPQWLDVLCGKILYHPIIWLFEWERSCSDFGIWLYLRLYTFQRFAELDFATSQSLLWIAQLQDATSGTQEPLTVNNNETVYVRHPPNMCDFSHFPVLSIIFQTHRILDV